MKGTSRFKQPRRQLAALVLAVTVPIVFSIPAMARPLVTRDGSVIEARGPWKVQGRLVIFELPDGRLASLQLGEVDLDASRAAAVVRRAVAERPAPSRPPQRPSVLVLTDADVRKAPVPRDSTSSSAASGGETEKLPERDRRLIVSSWEETDDADGVVIAGELLNQSTNIATEIELAVLLYDREGELLKTAMATVTSRVLRPGQRARFRASGQGVFDYASLKFEAGSLAFCGRSSGGAPCAKAGLEGAQGSSAATSNLGGG